jgi:hypothetical protein
MAQDIKSKALDLALSQNGKQSFKDFDLSVLTAFELAPAGGLEGVFAGC